MSAARSRATPGPEWVTRERPGHTYIGRTGARRVQAIAFGCCGSFAMVSGVWARMVTGTWTVLVVGSLLTGVVVAAVGRSRR